MRLLDADRARHLGELTRALSVDPLAECQEHDRMSTPQIVVPKSGQNSAEAAIQCIIEDSPFRSIRLKLVLTPAGWRVDDNTIAGGEVAASDPTRVACENDVEVASWRKMLMDETK